MSKLFKQVVRAEILYAKASKDLQKASIEMLRHLLSGFSRTSFGHAYGLKSWMGVDEFRGSIPIHSFRELEPWISRVKAGERDVIWPGRPLAYVTTSGTTSKEKFVPVTQDFIDDYHRSSLLTFSRLLFRGNRAASVLNLQNLATHLPLIFSGRLLTLGGPSHESWYGRLPVGSITGLLYRPLPRLAVPPEIHNIPSYEEKMYAITRFALEAQVVGIVAVVPASLLVLYERLNDNPRALIDEIESGVMRPLQSAPKLSALLSERLWPNPKRAQELARILNRDRKFRPREVWPICGLTSYSKLGNPVQSAAIQEAYGDLRIIDPGLVASEGRVSVGMEPGRSDHAVLPLSSFLEFLPEGQHAETVLPHELEIGQRYIPIITSSNGLARYKLGDVVQVTRRVKGVPFIEFRGRTDNSLSVAGEKLTEYHCREAITRLRTIGYPIDGEWVIGIQRKGKKPLYYLVWEGDTSCPDFSRELDRFLQEINVSYRRKRQQSLIMSIGTRRVRKGEIRFYPAKFGWLGQSKPSVLFRDGDRRFDRLAQAR